MPRANSVVDLAEKDCQSCEMRQLRYRSEKPGGRQYLRSSHS
jgi:hypothetical protein